MNEALKPLSIVQSGWRLWRYTLLVVQAS